jgi:hypothetical protein
MDDQGSIEQCPGCAVGKTDNRQRAAANEQVKISRICIRRFVNVFLAFYQHIHLWENKVDVQPSMLNNGSSSFDCGIKLGRLQQAVNALGPYAIREAQLCA